MESARASAGLAAECRLPLRHRCHRWWRDTVRRLFHEERTRSSVGPKSTTSAKVGAARARRASSDRLLIGM